MGRDTQFEGVGLPISCRKGEVELLVLTFYPPIPILFPYPFSLLFTPLPSHLHPLNIPGGLGTGRVRLCRVVVEE